MERITSRSEYGNAYYLECFNGECAGLGCKNPNSCNLIDKACERLAAYEDAEEQGLLVRLPCKVGERWLDTQGNEIEVDAFHCDGLMGWSITYHYTDGKSCACNPKYFAGHYTRKEAEAVLGEQKRKSLEDMP